MEKLKKALDERLQKAKYTKRTGSPGKYKYEYGSGSGAPGKKVKENVGKKTSKKTIKDNFTVSDKKQKTKIENIIHRYAKNSNNELGYSNVALTNAGNLVVKLESKSSETIEAIKKEINKLKSPAKKEHDKKKESGMPEPGSVTAEDAEELYQGYVNTDEGQERFAGVAELDNEDGGDDIEFVFYGLYSWLDRQGYTEEDLDDDDLSDALYEMVDAGIR